MKDTSHLIGIGDNQPSSPMPTHCPPALLLSGDNNTTEMPMTEAQVNHLRRLLAWMRCEWMLDEDMQIGMLDAIQYLGSSGAITHEQATKAVAERAEKINQCPAYVRQAVKMLTKALRDHERKAGIIESSGQSQENQK